MMIFRVNKKCLINRAVSLFMCISLVFTAAAARRVMADEPTKFLNGDSAASFVLNNIDYIDIRGAQPWSAPAIYETGALNIMKGYGNQVFAKDDIISREQALAIAMRLAGRENDAKKAAEVLDSARTPANKIQEPFLYWSLGYLKIAADDGLISKQEFQDAAASNGQLGFNGQAPAQRQEMAYWIAKALKLPPKYDEQAILNNFNDWKQCDADKIAYIEATLQNRIMNGDGSGSFLPTGSLTREQAAQIGKNAESFLLPILKYTKTSGTIEKMAPSTKVQNGKKTDSIDFYVRNIDGSLTSINSGFTANPWDYRKGELNGVPQDANNTDLVVYKNGYVGGAGYLAAGDRIEYTYDSNGTVKFVNVVSSNLNTEYLVGQLKSIDPAGLTANLNIFFKSETPDINLTQQYGDLSSYNTIKQTFPLSKDVKFIVNGISVDQSKITGNDFVIVTVVNDVITKVQKFNPVYNTGATGVISGTVQDNNPSLGYITLYSQEGKGVGVNPITSDILRNYNYDSLNGVEVYKDHAKASTKDIIPGDTVFLRLNSDGRVTQISAASNYTIKYATIINMKDTSTVFKFDDGTQQTLTTDPDTRWFGADGSFGRDNIKEGDNVMLTLGVSPSGIKVFEVRSSNINSPVKNIYKGSLESFQNDTGNIFLNDVKTFGKTSFDWVPDRGIKKLPVANGCKVYVDGIQIPLNDLSKVRPYSTVYAVTKSDFGDNEKAIAILINTQQSSQMPIYNDSLMQLDTLNSKLKLKNSQINLPYKGETIFIRDGRLVSFNNLKPEDALSVASGYYSGTGGNYAAVVVAGEPVNSDYFEIYRGRINGINEGTNFSLQSYSLLEGNYFNFYNTGKSFDISPNTRLLDDTGLVSMRNFTVSGATYYGGKSVYVVSKNGEALLISTAPFTDMYSFKADITSVSPNALGLANGRIYNTNTYEWNQADLQSVNILNNSVIIKGDKIIKADQLSKGDKIKLFKNGNSATGNAYIIIVEG